MYLVACPKVTVKTDLAASTIRLAYALLPQAGIVHIALAEGFFKDEGLEVIPQAFAFGKPAMECVVKGEADLATTADTPFMFALLDRGTYCISAVIESSDRTIAMVVGKAAGIGKMEDLAGKTIAVTKGTSGEYFLAAFLMARGLDAADVNIVDILPNAMSVELKAGRIDAAVVWNPVLLEISEELAADGTVFFGDDVYTEHFCIAGKQDFPQDNPETMHGFMKALIRAEQFLKANPDKALDIISEYSHTEKSDLESILPLLRLRVSLDQTLPLLLEDEIRWTMKDFQGKSRDMPDYTEYIDVESLAGVAPERVRLIR